MKSIFIALVAIVAPLFMAGCASNTSPQAMTALPFGQVEPNPSLANAVAVGTVSGGQETNPMWMARVDNASFRQALSDSLLANGYLARTPTGAPYTLDAELIALEQPFIGFELDVTSTVRYTLRGAGAEKVYPVTAVGTGLMSDSVLAVERLRFANEKSIRANITQLLYELRGF